MKDKYKSIIKGICRMLWDDLVNVDTEMDGEGLMKSGR